MTLNAAAARRTGRILAMLILGAITVYAVILLASSTGHAAVLADVTQPTAPADPTAPAAPAGPGSAGLNLQLNSALRVSAGIGLAP